MRIAAGISAMNTNHRGSNTSMAYPTLTDLHTKVAVVVHRMGYDQRLTMDITAGLQARINQLRIGGGKGRMLDTRRSLPLDDLFMLPCLLELKQIVSDDEKAFLMGLIMIRLLEYLELHQSANPPNGLRHVLLIEEAHRLLRNVSAQTGDDIANPRGRAVEVFANILAEVRAFGEGIVILEQIPIKLAPDAVKNTNLKIVHRIVARDDREVLGAAMQADLQQSAYFGVLGSGEAIVFSEGMNSPALVSIPLSTTKGQGKRTLVDEQLRQAWASVADQGTLPTFNLVRKLSPVEREPSLRYQHERVAYFRGINFRGILFGPCTQSGLSKPHIRRRAAGVQGRRGRSPGRSRVYDQCLSRGGNRNAGCSSRMALFCSNGTSRGGGRCHTPAH